MMKALAVPILLLVCEMSLTVAFIVTTPIIIPVRQQQQKQQQKQQQQSMALCARSASSRSNGSSSSSGNNKSNNEESMAASRFEIFQRSSSSIVQLGADDDDDGVRMAAFFEKHDDWLPLFGSLAADSSVPAMVHLETSNDDDSTAEFDFDFEASSSTFPWKPLAAIPDNEEDKQVIGAFLDGTQAALMALPALQEEEDETDMAFLLEGRRMLAVSRFQVVRNANTAADAGTTTNTDDLLFATCWNELTQLIRDDQSNTGSLILLPDTYTGSGDDGGKSLLSHFCTTRLQQPLEWLGMDGSFEIASINDSQIPALRLLHKLEEDIPDLAARPDPNADSSSSSSFE